MKALREDLSPKHGGSSDVQSDIGHSGVSMAQRKAQ